MLDAAEARQLTTLLFAVGQLLKKVDAIADRVTAYEEGLALLRTEIEVRESLHQVWLEDRAEAIAKGNALWRRETEENQKIKNVEL